MTCTWCKNTTGTWVRTITPTPHRTVWTITILRLATHKQHTGVQSGTLTRTEAIANHLARVGTLEEGDVVIATHSIVRKT